MMPRAASTSLFVNHLSRVVSAWLGMALLSWAAPLPAAEAEFFRGINLNGPPLTIEGRSWEGGGEAEDFKADGKTFANQKVILKPLTEAARTEMIRSSVWGSEVTLEVRDVPPGEYQCFLYVWEDNNNERFSLFVNGRPVVEDFESGTAGMWKRLGPWIGESVDGRLVVSAKGAKHGAANLSGLEIWRGAGIVPEPEKPQFAGTPTPEELAFFEKRIRPVLAENCYECHSASAEKIKGGLLLDSRAGVRNGGDTGPAITPGSPEASLMIEAMRHASEDVAMPPKKQLPPLVIADFEEWVRMGAPDPRATDTVAAVQERKSIDWEAAREWWSLRPLSAPKPPAVKDAGWPAGEVDRFILARLEEAGIAPGAEADKRSLIRRATYDLTGLPPSPEEVASFLTDDSPGAFARVVDRLLDSPRYGERWGRHWLDVVRYADTAGDNSDYPIPQMHRYRDWVIAAFNRDLPYDEFVRDQLAGDLRGGENDEERLERVVATGYLANARRFGSRVDDYPQHLTIEDTIDNLGRAFLGLSLNCARCHDHKFDPVTTKDYYALYGIFGSTRYPWPGIELDKKPRDFVPLVAADKLAGAEEAREAKEKEQARLERQVENLKDAMKKAPGEEKKGFEAKIEKAEEAATRHAKQPLPFELAYAVAESDKIADAAVQQKGDPAKPGERVPRRFLTVFGGEELREGKTTSGRAQLADWVLAEDNPLPARVMVNRIWLHHFGRGIVATPNDFGKQGQPPTHPELLDYLAARFRDGGWSVKEMHRLIMLSRTYRLAATRGAEALDKDPGNELLAGYPMLRLDAESIRDTLLALGGNLDLTPAGAHPFPPSYEWKYTQHKPFKDVYQSERRSVYLMTQRIQRHPFLAIFDGADPSASTPARPTSTTPVQALYLLNDEFVHGQAGRVADRLAPEGGGAAVFAGRAYELIFSRPAEEAELEAARDFLDDARARLGEAGMAPGEAGREARRALVRVLFRLNEFVYLG